MTDDIKILRELAIKAISKKNYKQAFDLRYKVIEQGHGDFRDFFFLGELNTIINDYQEAEEWLTQCIEFGEKYSRYWYASSAYVLRAYARIKLNKKDKALLDIAYLKENYNDTNDTSITWLQRHGQPIIDLELLKKMI